MLSLGVDTYLNAMGPYICTFKTRLLGSQVLWKNFPWVSVCRQLENGANVHKFSFDQQERKSVDAMPAHNPHRVVEDAQQWCPDHLACTGHNRASVHVVHKQALHPLESY